MLQDGVSVTIFDTHPELHTIEVGSNVQVQYFSYFSNAEQVQKRFLLAGEKSDVRVKSFHYALGNSLKVSMT